MKVKKFSAINFQPIETFGCLLGEIFSDFCVCTPCPKTCGKEEWFDPNLLHLALVDEIPFWLNGRMNFVVLSFIISYDRFYYLKKGETWIRIGFDDAISKENNFLCIELHCRSNEEKDLDIPLVERNLESMSKKRKFPTSKLDDPAFVVKLREFLKTKFVLKEDFEEWTNNFFI